MRYIVANWKMNMDLSDITKWFEGIKTSLPSIPEEKLVIIAASAPYLGMLSVLTKTNKLKLASQDVSLLEKGAHTGEVGAFQIKDFCEYSIIGHSERKEDIQDSIKKRDICLANGITPILCFSNIQDASKMYKPGTFLAWEDPTNISKDGNYNAKPKADIETGVNQIRAQIPAEAVLVYGGSVNKDNISDLSSVKGLDGVLPGNASKDADHFAQLVLKF